jgi:polyphosphate:AMP phosphotransferase
VFEAAELGHKINKKDYENIEPQLRMELLEVQQELRKAPFPVIVLFSGVDGAGKSETVNLLNSWMDPRWTLTRAYTERSEEERERPPYWRYWRDLPPKGKFGFYLSAWTSRPVIDRVYERINDAEFDQSLDRIAKFERLLIDDGACILKFWMHLEKKQQKKRLKTLEKDPLQSWRVTQTDWKHFEMYDSFIGAAERLIMRTSTGRAPWHIVEGANARYREVTVARIILDAIRHQLQEQQRLDALQAAEAAEKKKAEKKKAANPERRQSSRQTILQSLDTLVLGKDEYEQQLEEQQARVAALFRQARQRRMSVVLVFEGWDAAGKGGAIRRLTSALDARDYQVIPIAAPTDEERAHHYLWRFWRHLSRAGRLTLFDRSWYGRVLVERVEGFAQEAEWRRAYAEINHFEENLVSHGIVLLKYWLHITKEEQLIRFKSREETPFKRWKLTEEDWRNREKWDDYEESVNEMIARTSTRLAPWTLVEANNKRFARVKVLRTFADHLESCLEQRGTNGKPAIATSAPKKRKKKNDKKAKK